MSLVLDDVMITHNPASGAEVGPAKVTPAEQVNEIVARARAAQRPWAERPWSERRDFLARWSRVLSRDADRWAELIRDETGKPRAEALAGDVISTLDGIRWTIKHGGRAPARSESGPGWQRMMLMPTGRLRWCPVGGGRNDRDLELPLYLNPPHRPGPRGGQCRGLEAVRAGDRNRPGDPEKPGRGGRARGPGGPRSLGGAEVGQALVHADLDKGVFTGGIPSGRRVLAARGPGRAGGRRAFGVRPGDRARRGPARARSAPSPGPRLSAAARRVWPSSGSTW